MSEVTHRPFSIVAFAGGITSFDLGPVEETLKEFLQEMADGRGPLFRFDCSVQKRVQYFQAVNPTHEGPSSLDIVVVTGSLPEALVNSSGLVHSLVHQIAERVAIAAKANTVDVLLFGKAYTLAVETKTDATAS